MENDTLTRIGGSLCAIGGALFLPYALSKGELTDRIVADGWSLWGTTPSGTALLYHLAETLFVAMLVVGAVSLHRRVDRGTRLARAGIAVTVAGAGATVLAHVGEHLLPALTVPALTGGADWFVWSYYLSWLGFYLGLGILGVGLVASPGVPRWLPGTLVAAPPIVVLLGGTVVLLDLFTFAGALRIVAGLVFVAVGRWLWTEPAFPAAARGRPAHDGGR